METPAQYRQKAFGQTTRTQQTNVYSGGSSGAKAYHEATANTSPGESPQEYRERVEAQQAAQQQPTTSPSPQRSITGLDMLNPNNPADNRVIQQRVQAQQQQQQATTIKAMYQPSRDIMKSVLEDKPAPSPTSPRQLTQSELSRIKENYAPAGGVITQYTDLPGAPQQTNLVDQYTGFLAGAQQFRRVSEEKLSKAQETGYKQAEDFEFWKVPGTDIQPSVYFASLTGKKADEIRTDLPIVKYPANFLASQVEGLGMVPGGLEVIVREPGVIPAALTVGAIGTPLGIADQAREDPMQLATDIGLSFLAGAGLSKAAPRFKSSRVIEVEGSGNLAPIDYGKTLTVLDRPLASYSQGRLYSGAAPAPAELIAGKTITAFDRLETASFKKTLDKTAPSEAEFFRAGQDITSRMYETKKPVFTPEKFEVLSENIPTSARPAVEQAIVQYSGELKVYGSVTQKQQLGQYMTRKPQDIEVIVDSSQKFLAELEPRLKQQGVKYSIEGAETTSPKVYFETPTGNMKGIEVFGVKSHSRSLDDFLGISKKEKSSKEKSSEKKDAAFTQGSDIAYGYKSQRPLVVDGLDTLRLSEQAARKHEGATVLKDLQLQPKHEGRVKDIRDLIEIGTGYAVEKKVPIERNLLKYTETAASRYPEIRESPVVNYLVENKKLPSKAEINQLAEINLQIKPDAMERTLLASKSRPAQPSDIMSSMFRNSLKGIDKSPSPIFTGYPRHSLVPSSLISPAPPARSSPYMPFTHDKQGGNYGFISDIPSPAPSSPSPIPPDSSGYLHVPPIIPGNVPVPIPPKNRSRKIVSMDIDLDLGSKNSIFDPNIGIKRGSRKNRFGDVNEIIFGR